MEISSDASRFWNSLGKGGNEALASLSEFLGLPSAFQETLSNQLLQCTEFHIAALPSAEISLTPPEYKHHIHMLRKTLEAFPHILTTPEARVAGIQRVKAIDLKARPSCNLEVLITCDRVLTQLTPPPRAAFRLSPQEQQTLAEAASKLGMVAPADIVDTLLVEGPEILKLLASLLTKSSSNIDDD